MTSLDWIFITVNFEMVPACCLCQLQKQLLSGTCLTLSHAQFGSQLCLGEGWALSRVRGPGCCQQQGLFSVTMFVLLLQGHIQGMFISGSFSSTEERVLPPALGRRHGILQTSHVKVMYFSIVKSN